MFVIGVVCGGCWVCCGYVGVVLYFVVGGVVGGVGVVVGWFVGIGLVGVGLFVWVG